MNDSSNGSMNKYYDFDYQITTILLFGLTSVIGIFGNIMVVAVVLTVRGMMSPTNCYLVSLAIADCLFFISSTPRDITAMLLPEGVYVFGSVGCSILTFLPYLSINASSLSIAAFTIERYIAICHPIKAQYICTTKRAKFIIIAVWCFSLLYNSSWLFMVKIKPLPWDNQVTCTFSFPRDMYIYVYFADLTLFYIIPLLLYFGLYGKMACILFRAKFIDDDRMKNGTKKFLKHDESANADNSVMPSPTLYNLHKRQSYQTNSKAIGNSTNKSRLQVVKMLVVIVCTFALCWLPYRGLVVYNSFASTKFANRWYILFAKTMIFINCAINPILYNLMSAKFRRSFKLMFAQLGLCCRYNRLYSWSFQSGTPSQMVLRRRSTKSSAVNENYVKNHANYLQVLTTCADSKRRKSADL